MDIVEDFSTPANARVPGVMGGNLEFTKSTESEVDIKTQVRVNFKAVAQISTRPVHS